MNHHFLVMTDGKLLGIHNYNNPITESYYVWEPPKRSTPYIFKAGDGKEKIYAVLFQLTERDREAMQNHSRFGDYRPERLRGALDLLDLVFSKDIEDFSVEFRKFIGYLNEDIILVTNKGARSHMVLRMKDPAYKANCVLTPPEYQHASMYFMNIVLNNLEKLNQSTQEAFDNACATGVLGDYLYAKPPRWWLEAKNHYDPEDSSTVPTSEDGSEVLRSDGASV